MGNHSKASYTRTYLRAAVEMLEHVIHGSERLTGPRQVLIALATNNVVKLCSGDEGVTIAPEVLQTLAMTVQRMGAIHTAAKQIRLYTDSSFLFFHPFLLAPLCKHLYNLPGISGSRRLSYLIKSFCGSVAALPFTDPTKVDKKGQLALSVSLRDYIIKVLSPPYTAVHSTARHFTCHPPLTWTHPNPLHALYDTPHLHVHPPTRCCEPRSWRSCVFTWRRTCACTCTPSTCATWMWRAP